MAHHKHDHDHDNAHAGHAHAGAHVAKKRVSARAKDKPGHIYIERNIHDEAIVISGSLAIRYETGELNAWLAEEIETAAQGINERGGIVGHIKAAVTATTTSMISATDEKAMIHESPAGRAKITLAAIVFMVDPQDAETIVRGALERLRSRLQT